MLWTLAVPHTCSLYRLGDVGIQSCKFGRDNMVNGSINIDDAGNPGADSGSEFLSPSRKSWTAVIIPESVASLVSKAMSIPIPMFADEGLSSAGTSIDLPNWGDVVAEQKVAFCTSKQRHEIQIADFVAFAIVRTQWILAQQTLGKPPSRGDLEFLKTTSDFNVLNLPAVMFSVENISREALEFFLQRDRRDKGLPSRPRKPGQH